MFKLSVLVGFTIFGVIPQILMYKMQTPVIQNPVIQKFREYIQIDTSQSEHLPQAVDFWKHQAEEYGLEFVVYKPVDKPICVLTLPGANLSLPSIMLNSHMDVVPANSREWKYPPYSAAVDDQDNIYGRGTQDTKDIAIQYLEAIGRIKRNNITLQRTIHMTLMPDEETGGFSGMQPFVNSPDFKNLNVGFALDEGLVSETDDFYATYQDRMPWFLKYTVEGVGGHGFTIPKDAAVIKLTKLLDIMMEYRKPLAEAVQAKASVELGPYTTLNVNMVNGGVTPNVIPLRFTLVADMRLSPSENTTEILSLVNSWATYAGENTKLEFIRQIMVSLATPVDYTNPYWTVFKETINQLGYNVHPIICPATSDMVYVRNVGVPAIGFAPKRHTTSRVHGFDEYLNAGVFLDGIDVYEALIERLGNLP